MRGGKRPGAGRKNGSVTKRKRVIFEKAAEQGVMPVDVMLADMRFHHERAEAEAKKGAKGSPALIGEERKAAREAARDAAPYLHPRLATVAHTGRNGGPILTADLSKITDAQLAALEAVFGPLAGGPGDDDGGDPGGEGAPGG